MAAAFAEAPPVVHALGGSLGSALSLLLFYPLERARIELQSQASSAAANDDETTSAEELESDTADITTSREQTTTDTVQQSPSLESASSDGSWESLEQQRPEDEPSLAPSPSSSVENASEETSSPSSSSSLVNDKKKTQKKFGLLVCLLRLHKRGALYQGVTPVISTIFTSQFVFFYMNAFVKRWLRSIRPNINNSSDPIVSLLSSCLAGIGNVLLTNPLWVVNMAIITGEAKTSNLWKEFWVMLKKRGLKHMWNGTSASILLVSNPVIQFFCYEQFKQAKLLEKQKHLGHLPRSRSAAPLSLAPLEAFSIGALAKAIATVITYPLQLTQTVLRLKDNGYKGTLDCLIQLFKRGGMKEWYTGMRAKLLQTVLSAAFTFLTYEQILGAVQIAFGRALRNQPPRGGALL